MLIINKMTMAVMLLPYRSISHFTFKKKICIGLFFNWHILNVYHYPRRSVRLPHSQSLASFEQKEFSILKRNTMHRYVFSVYFGLRKPKKGYRWCKISIQNLRKTLVNRLDGQITFELYRSCQMFTGPASQIMLKHCIIKWNSKLPTMGLNGKVFRCRPRLLGYRSVKGSRWRC